MRQCDTIWPTARLGNLSEVRDAKLLTNGIEERETSTREGNKHEEGPSAQKHLTS